MLLAAVSLLILLFIVVFLIMRFVAAKFFNENCNVHKVPMLVPAAPRLATVNTTGDKSVALSIVIPMYNEVERLPLMMTDTLKYLEAELKSNPQFRAEVIFVDDCSSDASRELAAKMVATFSSRISGRVVGVSPNRGKGYAVRQGVFASNGMTILMADADGAAPMAELTKLRMALAEGEGGIAVGSRCDLEAESVAERSPLRTLLMRAFHLLVNFTFLFTGYQGGIRDTQCGFKLFTRKAALQVFSNARIERWAFDVELLIAARHFGVKVTEVPINWHEVGGSKLSWKGMIRTGMELALICFAIRFRFWPLEAVV